MRYPTTHSETVSGLRTRYIPRSRLGQGVISMSPWLDLLLLVAFFLMIRGNFIVEPGVVISLPEVPMRGGATPEMVAVVLSVETGEPGVREEIVVFNDERFRVVNPKHMQRLKTAIGSQARRRNAGSLLLEADRRVQHGTLVQLYAMARDLNLREVEVAARPSPEVTK